MHRREKKANVCAREEKKLEQNVYGKKLWIGHRRAQKKARAGESSFVANRGASVAMWGKKCSYTIASGQSESANEMNGPEKKDAKISGKNLFQ